MIIQRKLNAANQTIFTNRIKFEGSLIQSHFNITPILPDLYRKGTAMKAKKELDIKRKEKIQFSGNDFK